MAAIRASSSLPDEPGGILTVSALTRDLQGVLGATFGDVWVRGEISQPRRPASGHVYLTLKDAGAVLPAVIWRTTAARLRFRPEDGQEVLAHGGIDVYPPHGRYQLVIRALQPVGAGALQLAFEQLRRRLEAEGLFAPEHKRPLPSLPRRIALVTSRTGAAVRDMVTVIQRRYPPIAILLVPVRVQGDGAATEIARALALADEHARADVIIVGRGGGSLEDLWAFNEEPVARAIAACRVPVVSAVGHETDTTIADLVADVRAATPSQAGELVVPVYADLLARLDRERDRLAHRMAVRLERAWQRLEALGDRPALRTSERLVGPRRRQLEQLAVRLRTVSPAAGMRRRAQALRSLAGRLRPPLRRRLDRHGEQLLRAGERLGGAADRIPKRAGTLLDALDHRLQALSPLAVLGRGYSLTVRLDEGGREGAVVRDVEGLAPGHRVRTHLATGAHVDSRVESVQATPPAPRPLREEDA